jgi:hypothetical protein
MDREIQAGEHRFDFFNRIGRLIGKKRLGL